MEHFETGLQALLRQSQTIADLVRAGELLLAVPGADNHPIDVEHLKPDDRARQRHIEYPR